MNREFLFDEMEKYDSFPEWEEYEIYHDESKENQLLHGYLLVPVRTKAYLLTQMREIRRRYNCDSKLHYNDLTGQKSNCKIKTAGEIVPLLCDSLRSKGHTKGLWGQLPPRCKFILFKKKNIGDMSNSYFDFGGTLDKKEVDIRKIETLFRIGLKGGLHYLFDEQKKVKIVGFYTDGYAWTRPFDNKRIIERLSHEKRSYIDLDSNLTIEAIVSNHKKNTCTDSDRAELLQACDLLIGAFKNCIFDKKTDSFKTKIAKPVRDIMEKKAKRKGNFINSGHYKAYTLTKAMLEDGVWAYYSLDVLEKKSLDGQEELALW